MDHKSHNLIGHIYYWPNYSYPILPHPFCHNYLQIYSRYPCNGTANYVIIYQLAFAPLNSPPIPPSYLYYFPLRSPPPPEFKITQLISKK